MIGEQSGSPYPLGTALQLLAEGEFHVLVVRSWEKELSVAFFLRKRESEGRPVPALDSARIQRYGILLRWTRAIRIQRYGSRERTEFGGLFFSRLFRDRNKTEKTTAAIAVGETVTPLHPPSPPLVGVPIGTERGCQHNDRTLADG